LIGISEAAGARLAGARPAGC